VTELPLAENLYMQMLQIIPGAVHYFAVQILHTILTNFTAVYVYFHTGSWNSHLWVI